MKLKSLLIGSAAVMAVSTGGAKAADAIVMAEPEPMEYVRVCDVYGTGFFYIPGTETCLKLSGYVWYQIGAATGQNGFAHSTRARFNIDARSETEWGTLRSYIRFQNDWTVGTDATVDPNVSLDQGYIQLGGFFAGYTESAWAATLNGGASNWGSHSWSGLAYGYAQRHVIGYNFTGSNGFFGTISLEADGLVNGGNGYIPDVVAKIGVNQGWGAVWLKAGYDESYNAAGASGFGIGAGVHINMPNTGSSFRLLAFYADSDNRMAAIGTVASQFSVLASYNHQFTSTFGASIGAQYMNNFYAAGTATLTGVSAWQAELSTVWFPVQNFEVRAEINYAKVSNVATGTWAGYFRLTRYFGD